MSVPTCPRRCVLDLVHQSLQTRAVRDADVLGPAIGAVGHAHVFTLEDHASKPRVTTPHPFVKMAPKITI